MNAKDVIRALSLEPLPEEGGYFREVYRAEGVIPEEVLPSHGGPRRYSTSIYYLVTPEEFSALHRVKSDEVFHFYRGDPVRMIQIDASGELKEIVLGSDLEKGQLVQAVVPAGVWQGTRLVEGGKWALMGCTVAPGFEFADFEAASRADLVAAFPRHRDRIELFTRT